MGNVLFSVSLTLRFPYYIHESMICQFWKLIFLALPLKKEYSFPQIYQLKMPIYLGGKYAIDNTQNLCYFE